MQPTEATAMGWETILPLIGNGASAVAAIVVMVMFMNWMQKDREAERELREEQLDAYKSVVANCNDVIKDNTAALRENAAALAKIKYNA